MEVTSSVTLRERPSPHKLALCILIQLFVQPSADLADEDRMESEPLDELPEDAQRVAYRRLAFFLRSEIRRTELACERSLPELCRALAGASAFTTQGAQAFSSKKYGDIVVAADPPPRLRRPPEEASAASASSSNEHRPSW